MRGRLTGNNANATMVPGKVFKREPFISVRWPWLLLPLFERALTAALLVVSILMTRRDPLLKSSTTTLITSIENLIRDQSSSVMKHVTQESQKMREMMLAAEHAASIGLGREALMRSLAYQEANERRNQVENAHDGIFEWIFQHDGESKKHEHRRWSDITDFIRSPEDKLYWISGKPGSGKSTLMKFLLKNDRIKEMLGQTSHTKSCVIASHFIWARGRKPSVIYLYDSLRFTSGDLSATGPMRT
ncbi:hypothetical protein CSOJ01_13451 [Colletotrichum sojae]|uniref:Nephrocystin 3-like N-terminal domain-containing protein n=1 Tax=Colletotrichum sojae TaxID=2175907 RepID=A0A8H6ISC9_9PEZI|nr:hypothetical protein CSOJ01_13451 [Colletotrichum sojae]